MKRKLTNKSTTDKSSPKSVKRRKTVLDNQSASTSTENLFTKNVKIENKIEFDSFIKNIECKRKEYFVGSYAFNDKRIKTIRDSKEPLANGKSVLYWMSRDQRVQDNWAFHYAQKLSLKFKSNFHVCFCLVPKFLDATIRHYDFLLKGLQEVEKECRQLNINFHLLLGTAKERIPEFVEKNRISVVINDFCPLRVPLQWIKEVSDALPTDVYIYQVDAHNVVPVWDASPKLEVGARTIRSKINGKLTEFLTEFPPVIKHPKSGDLPEPVDWESARKSLDVDMTVKEVVEFIPGYKAGLQNLWKFIYSNRLKNFNLHRNNPTKSCLSNISPWLHFGQISAQRCILEVQSQKSRAKEGVDIFIEESLVRRELADNFCYYNPKYDSLSGASNWARETLEFHRLDERPYKYTIEQLDSGQTHDKLWNAAQLQMVSEGKMHGFLRMYWAKKILEWTGEGPDEALKRAIWLNDRYSIDGRDPNGFTGIMWSICGVHDQGWAERPVFGKIRYMNYKGCERKFDVKLFESTYKTPK